MTNAAVWCCGTCGCAGCVHPPCLQGEIDYTVRYPSIGRPKFNTNPQHYAGVLWPAWWNVIARTATLKVDITFTLTPPLPALPISFRIEGDLGLAGTNGNQDANIFADSWGQYPTMPCGPWPYAIVLCGTGPAVDDAPITAGNNPVWWPYRNRYLIPRWQGNLKMTRNSVVTYEPTTTTQLRWLQTTRRATEQGGSMALRKVRTDSIYVFPISSPRSILCFQRRRSDRLRRRG